MGHRLCLLCTCVVPDAALVLPLLLRLLLCLLLYLLLLPHGVLCDLNPGPIP